MGQRRVPEESSGGKVNRELKMADRDAPLAPDLSPVESPTQLWDTTGKGSGYLRRFPYGSIGRDGSVPPSATERFSFSATSSQWIEMIYGKATGYMTFTNLTVNGKSVGAGLDAVAFADETIRIDLAQYGATFGVSANNRDSFSPLFSIGHVVPRTRVTPSLSVVHPPEISSAKIYNVE